MTGRRNPFPLSPFEEAHDQGDVRRVVERPVVQRVAVYRRPVAVAVEVRGEDDRLVGLRRVGPWEDPDDVRRAQRPTRGGERRAQAVAQVEGGERPSSAARGDEGVGVLPTPGQHGPERPGAQRERDEPAARRRRHRRCRCRRRRRPAGQGDAARVRRRPAWRLHREARVGDGDHPGRPRLLQRRAPLLVSRQPGPPRRVADHQLPAHVAQRVGPAVAAIGERDLQRRRRCLRADGDDVVQEPERPPLDVHARAGDGDLLHRHPLVPRPAVPDRLHPRRCEPPGDVTRGALVPARPGIAPLHGVGGEDRRPLPPGARVGIDGATSGGLQEREDGESDGKHGGARGGKTGAEAEARRGRYTGRRTHPQQGRAQGLRISAAICESVPLWVAALPTARLPATSPRTSACGRERAHTNREARTDRSGRTSRSAE